jgi:probable HAF family extracellular repeat protein
MTPLEGLPLNAYSSRANDITPDGAFTVGYTVLGPIGTTESEAFRLSDSAILTLLGDLPGGQHFSYATGVAADGDVITGYSESAAGTQAFIWTEDDGMLPLSSPPAVFNGTFATNISADGNSIVGYGISITNGQQQAFRWQSQTGIKVLGALPGYETSSAALATSGDGATIVGAAINGNAIGFNDYSTAFIWNEDFGMRNLQQVLVEQFALGTDLSGWTLIAAADISADGCSIVGTGLNPDGDLEAWLVRLDHPISVPEPCIPLFLAAAALLVVSWRRRLL